MRSAFVISSLVSSLNVKKGCPIALSNRNNNNWIVEIVIMVTEFNIETVGLEELREKVLKIDELLSQIRHALSEIDNQTIIITLKPS